VDDWDAIDENTDEKVEGEVINRESVVIHSKELYWFFAFLHDNPEYIDELFEDDSPST